MQIRVRETGAVMYESEFRAYIKETDGASWDRTTDEILEALGADVVFEGAQATGGTVYQYSQRDGVEEVDGKWYTKYILGPVFSDLPATDKEPAKTAAEQEVEYQASKNKEFSLNARTQRNNLLSESDWTQVADAPVDKAAWATYRQALRDISSQEGFPISINWPIKP
jgi:gentisate 1,2-dioxygenase